MKKLFIALTVILTVTACANHNLSKDMLNKDMLKEAQPIYQSCLEDYKKTMSEDEARKACAEKLKSSYEKVTNM